MKKKTKGYLQLAAGGTTFLICLVIVLLYQKRSATAFKYAMAVTKKHPISRRELGSSIKAKLRYQGFIPQRTDLGDADFTLSLVGSKASGQLHVTSRKNKQRRIFYRIILKVNNRKFVLQGWKRREEQTDEILD